MKKIISEQIHDRDEEFQDLIGDMVAGGVEDGMDVTYDDTAGKFDFDLHIATATKGGVITGTDIAVNAGTGAVTNIAMQNIAYHADAVDPTGTDRLNAECYLFATRVYNAVYNDLAEFFDTKDPKAYEAGQVMVMTEYGVAASTRRGQKAVVGVYSDTYGYSLGSENQEEKIPVGLSGRVNVFITEPCEIGDFLISDKNGFATVASRDESYEPGIVLGKVLKNKNDTFIERIPMLIMNR